MQRANAGVPAYDIRLATEADEPAVLELYLGLSATSQHMRFSSRMSPEALARAAALAPGGVFQSVVAVSGDRVLGEARIGSPTDEDHDFAVTVADDAQRRGLGTALLERLRAEARARGIVSLRAMVRIDNLPMLTLLQRVGGAIVLVSDGDVVFDIGSDEKMPAWPVGSIAPKVLIEAPGLYERPVTTALRAAGWDVRQCAGPGRGRHEPCPLLSTGRCRLAEEADRIHCLLPETEPESRAIRAAHLQQRPERLAGAATS